MEFNKLSPICERCKDMTKSVFTPVGEDRVSRRCTKCNTDCFTRQIIIVDFDSSADAVCCEKCGCKDGRAWYDFDNIKIYCSACGGEMFCGWLQRMEIDEPGTQPVIHGFHNNIK